MNYSFIITIFCLFAVQGIWGNDDDVYITTEEQELQNIRECAEETNVAYFKNQKIYPAALFLWFFYPGPQSDKAACMVACVMRKDAEAQGLSLPASVLHSIELAYQYGFSNSQVTYQDFEAKVEICSINETKDCEFYKCLDLLKPPFLHVFGHILKPVAQEALYRYAIKNMYPERSIV